MAPIRKKPDSPASLLLCHSEGRGAAGRGEGAGGAHDDKLGSASTRRLPIRLMSTSSSSAVLLQDGRDGQLHYGVKLGPFLKLCKVAHDNQPKPAVLIMTRSSPATCRSCWRTGVRLEYTRQRGDAPIRAHNGNPTGRFPRTSTSSHHELFRSLHRPHRRAIPTPFALKLIRAGSNRSGTILGRKPERRSRKKLAAVMSEINKQLEGTGAGERDRSRHSYFIADRVSQDRRSVVPEAVELQVGTPGGALLRE